PRPTVTPTAGCWRPSRSPRRRPAGPDARPPSRTPPSISIPAARWTTGRERASAAAQEELDRPPSRLGARLRARLRRGNRARPGARGQPAAGLDVHARPDDRGAAGVGDGDRHRALKAMSQNLQLWVDSPRDA